jgi:phosphoribosyl 1,2-cyclic phosphodiesterase
VIRFASLGSGSGGNALVVDVDGTCLLLDCGFGPRECKSRLERLGLAPSDLAGIVVTHEHDDHASGVLAVAERFDLPVWLTYGTFRAIAPDMEPNDRIHVIDGHSAFVVDGCEVLPFPVPHDAREPVQYVFSDGALRLGVLTDTGAPTRHIQRMLSGCEALVLECNHDAQMLARGPYPRWLKERIAGPLGHLENDQAADILNAIDRTRLHHVVAAHLSETNNAPTLAREALAGVLGCAPDWIAIAEQDGGLDWRSLA